MAQTMRVRMTTGRSWMDADGRTVAVGPDEECVLEVGEARRLLESDQAVPVAEKPVERAEKRGPGRPRKIEQR